MTEHTHPHDGDIEHIVEQIRTSCLERHEGGPFGALVFKDGKIVGEGVNRVLGNHDPTAHAEVEAIRDACRRLGTHDLSGCTIYATGFPCPMCMSAIIWANIREVYFSADYDDASAIGFRDDYIRHFIVGEFRDTNVLTLKQADKKAVLQLYRDYAASDHSLY